ncbi:amidohydrolase family protein [Streptomyces sp. MK5]|uniref:amidohydrolase family protein n=1 Tax=Streptomyces sp. MK5 TaxID=3064253 RepID=UPI002741F5C9|nr:amidohydrolase family protein [Streptomyces sp. MK5]
MTPVPFIAVEEHWIMPDVTSRLRAVPQPDESLAFNEMGDNQERLEDLGAGRIAAMDAQGIDVSVLALTPPGVQPLPPGEALALSRAANDMAAASMALLRHALSVTSVDRLIFSTDYPFQRPTREEVDSFLNHFSTDAEREQFSSANAASLYGIDFSFL